MASQPTHTAVPEQTALQHTLLRAEGFSCPSCVAKIEKALVRLPGVERAQVQFASGRIEVDHDGARTPVDALVAEVGRLGYPSRPAAF